MKTPVNDLRVGNIVLIKDQLWSVIKSHHVKPGKGPAYLQVELKNIKDERKLNERLRTSDTVERVRLEQNDHSYLYTDGDDYYFMDAKSFEQVIIKKTMIGERAAFLQENMTVSIETYEGVPVNISLPEHVTLEIIETEPTIKGQTATGSYKPAVCTNGIKVMVPQFIDGHEKIIVNSLSNEYIKRAE